MMNSHEMPRDIDREIGELLLQLRSPDVRAWIEDHRQFLSGAAPRTSAAEFVARSRQILSQVESFMDAATIPTYEAAPAPVKRVTELLFDINTREHLFALMYAYSRQVGRSAESGVDQSDCTMSQRSPIDNSAIIDH